MKITKLMKIILLFLKTFNKNIKNKNKIIKCKLALMEYDINLI